MLNRLHITLALLTALGASGCTTATDALGLQSVIPSTQTGDVPGAQKEGSYPKVGNIPTGQTTQMSRAEKRQIQRELAPAAAHNTTRTTKATTQGYKRDLSEMEKLLDYHDKRKAEPDYE